MTEPNIESIEEEHKSGYENIAQEPDLIDEPALKTILLQFNPQVSKDIVKIEKGVENFFLFNSSSYALAKVEDMQYFSLVDLKMLAEKHAIVLFQYLEYEETLKDFLVRKVVLRPTSLKIEQVKKIKRACAIESCLSILKYISIRDRIISEKIVQNELDDYISKKLVHIETGEWIDYTLDKIAKSCIENIDSISFAFQMEKIWKLELELINMILHILTKKDGVDYAEVFANFKMDEEKSLAISHRAGLSILQEIALDFYLVRPSFSHMVKIESEKVIPTGTEFESLLRLFGQIAKSAIIQLLPLELSMGYSADSRLLHNQYIEELEQHASFSTQAGWIGAEIFLSNYKNLSTKVENLKEIRNEYMIDVMLKNKLSQLNMQFDPLYFSLEEFSVDPEFAKQTGIDKVSLFNKFLEKCKSNPDLVSHIEKRAGQSSSGIHLLYKENLPTSFIRFKKKRNFLNSMAKESSMKNGIYEFLKEIPTGFPNREHFVEEQLNLSKAITDWEAELEAERIKKEQAEKGIFVRFLEWLASLFGIEAQNSRESDKPGNKKSLSKSKSKPSLGVYGGPKEREIIISTQVQKAIEYVDRQNRGLIWLDDVLAALNSSNYSLTNLADMLFFDKQRRYLEIRSLNDIRHVFIRKELENDNTWLQNTIDYLENIQNKKQEHNLLTTELKKRLE
ncbi:MAG: hypothetical protein GW938_13295 [Leptospira sp.]|jgi:hypothetical protein|nr:hypothetical protein [Leptospira sp.]NCS92825.1 hypothetical protein [Leptospira sp.]